MTWLDGMNKQSSIRNRILKVTSISKETELRNLKLRGVLSAAALSRLVSRWTTGVTYRPPDHVTRPVLELGQGRSGISPDLRWPLRS